MKGVSLRFGGSDRTERFSLGLERVQIDREVSVRICAFWQISGLDLTVW